MGVCQSAGLGNGSCNDWVWVVEVSGNAVLHPDLAPPLNHGYVYIDYRYGYITGWGSYSGQ
jgi:hypothetical protein